MCHTARWPASASRRKGAGAVWASATMPKPTTMKIHMVSAQAGCPRHPLCFQLPRDERLDHRSGAIGLWSGLCHPLVLAALEDLKLAVAACCPVGGGELLLDSWEHVVVELALHDEQRHQRDRFVAIEDLLWVALEDRVPRFEEGRVVLDHAVALHALRVLEARV